jgi:hypothetical protein
MAKDASIQNQKVFVRLQSVLDLQKRYHETAKYHAQLKAQGGTMAESVLERKRAFEMVIDILELPIPKPEI